MELFQVLQKCVVALLVAIVGWLACVALCASVTIQRHVFYLHRLPIWWSQKLGIPESFGFLHNQVLPLRLSTSDGEKLYAWLVTPLALYARNEQAFLSQTSRHQDNSDIAMRLLRNPESKLVIYFHGNAGTVGQTRRTDAYRMVTSGVSERAHVLAFDYRGFGYSSGTPTETALIDDALSVIKWATTVGGVPTDRIVILAQSLGTGVASGAVHALIQEAPDTRFAGLCMCAAFTDAPSVLYSYRVAGFVPLLYPLKLIPSFQSWFSDRILDKWPTRQRLESIVKDSHRVRLTLIAATCDEVVPWYNTDNLFYAVIDRVTESGSNREVVDEISDITDLSEGGSVQQWKDGERCIRKVIVRYGGKSCFAHL